MMTIKPDRPVGCWLFVALAILALVAGVAMSRDDCRDLHTASHKIGVAMGMKGCG
jgi:hypothetical protein